MIGFNGILLLAISMTVKPFVSYLIVPRFPFPQVRYIWLEPLRSPTRSETTISVMHAKFWSWSQTSRFRCLALGQNLIKDLWFLIISSSSKDWVELEIVGFGSSAPRLVNLYITWFEQSPAAKRNPESNKMSYVDGEIVSKYWIQIPNTSEPFWSSNTL